SDRYVLREPVPAETGWYARLPAEDLQRDPSDLRRGHDDPHDRCAGISCAGQTDDAGSTARPGPYGRSRRSHRGSIPEWLRRSDRRDRSRAATGGLGGLHRWKRAGPNRDMAGEKLRTSTARALAHLCTADDPLTSHLQQTRFQIDAIILT